MQHNNSNRYKIGVDIWVLWCYYMQVRCGNDKRERMGRIRKNKPQSQVTRTESESQGERPSWKQEVGSCVSACDTKELHGERKSQEAEYRNRKDGMATGRTEEERDGDARNRTAPREPLLGDIGKRGKERAEG